MTVAHLEFPHVTIMVLTLLEVTFGPPLGQDEKGFIQKGRYTFTWIQNLNVDNISWSTVSLRACGVECFVHHLVCLCLERLHIPGGELDTVCEELVAKHVDVLLGHARSGGQLDLGVLISCLRGRELGRGVGAAVEVGGVTLS